MLRVRVGSEGLGRVKDCLGSRFESEGLRVAPCGAAPAGLSQRAMAAPRRPAVIQALGFRLHQTMILLHDRQVLSLMVLSLTPPSRVRFHPDENSL